MDGAVSKLAVRLVNCKISKWELDGEHNDQDRSVPSSVNNKSPPIRKIFVANLSGRTSYCDLRRLFRRYGKVIDAHVSRDKFTRTKRGFGFVTFKYPEDAVSVLKLQHGELKLHLRKLYVAAADSWHQPIELPDGTILWNPNSRDSSRHQQHSSVQEVDYPEAQTDNEVLPSSGSTAGNNREIGAVGCSGLPSYISSCNEVEQQQEGETENGGDGREVEGRECKIDMLNNDCLMHIFSFLNKRERIGIERVCKRWQTVGLDMWTCQKHLDFASLFPLASGFFRNMPILIAFLKRCGANLQSLDISHKAHHLNGPVLRTVATYCTNLQCLNLAGLPVTSSGLRILSAVSYKLRVLNLDGCSGAFDKDLHNVFLHSPHLESVTLSHNSVLTGKCLSGLARAPLKELVMDGCNNLRSRNLVNGLLVLKSLSRLSLNSCINLTSSDVADITGAVPMLCSLSLEHYFPLFNSTTLKALNQLHDLISLTLQLNPAVNDQIMDVIARSCHKIEELNITGCSSNSWEQMSVTDVGLRCLAALPNLVCLSMSYLANVSDTALEVIASRGKLRKLMCRGCPSFTDVGCISVVTSCNELELFDFSGCDLVSDATVQAALDSVKLRTNNIKLTLVVGGTSVSDFDIVEENSLLEVDCSDLCVAHLRPDFVDDIYFPSSEDEYYDDVDDLCDWECQSIYFGDDLEYYDDLSEDAASFGDAPCGFWD